MGFLQVTTIDILLDAKQQMHERYVETNEDMYSILKMLIDCEIEREKEKLAGYRRYTHIQPQPDFKPCKHSGCTKQAPQVGDYCGKCNREHKVKRENKRAHNKKWGS